MAGLSDVRALTISDENAADADRLVTAARPNTAATMANTTFAGGAARNVTVTTAGTGDNAKTNTIVGTDVFDNALTEVIVSTGSAEAVDGTKFFKTVTSITSSAKFAANIEIGSIASAAQAVGGGIRVRLKGFSIVSGLAAVTIKLSSAATSSLIKAGFTSDLPPDIPILFSL